jgi:hydroxyacylglutathione hydrolase
MVEIHTIPAFQDNYFWLVHARGSQDAWVVDPGAADPVDGALAQHGLKLAGIVVTHHHSDHTGGVSQLAERHGATVVGPVSDRFTAVDQPLADGDEVDIAGARFRVLTVPGHTLDHIAYHSASEQVLFCGDTLFAGGCGRVFEGTPAQMQASLARLAALPPETRIYCAHEYTLANLAFARRVEPANAALEAREADARTLREAGTPTVPSTISLELATNPFLRWDDEAVMKAAAERSGAHPQGPADVFTAIRRWKDAG